MFALNNDVVMMNDLARQVLDPSEQSILLGQAADLTNMLAKGIEATTPFWEGALRTGLSLSMGGSAAPFMGDEQDATQ